MEKTAEKQIVYTGEKHSRSMLKAVSWRIFGTLTTFGATLTLTRDLNIATIVGIVEFLAKIILFYIHERIWIRLNKII